MRLLDSWKRASIDAAVERHKKTLPAVLELRDRAYLDNYDFVLGMLTGPQTIQVRRNPRIIDVLRIRGSQRAFEKAVYHASKLEALEQ
ncbi:hypothetical protein IIE18_11425 [Pseudomonas sp. V1]|uniref:hypothetical protein n=1 Tax=Pseudomonas arcuscaelestis TaxID=2710591 RepID=UPI00193F30CD|nr:hypothetical protein [Pseudomonas arcuscaelestis]MBM3105752.1 hypothetical protein [Pseudomonas arcuscaelestis]